MDNLTAIILAAGKGTRMNSTDKNKVALEVKGRPMLVRTIDILKKTGINNIIVVVGFAKESVTSLVDEDVIIAEQKDQLGTGDAVKCALPRVPESSDCVLIIYGDDSFLHTPSTFKKLYSTYLNSKATVCFITKEVDDPTGFGRIIRNENGQIKGIIEEKNADSEQRKISEINLGCYLIDKKYLSENIDKIMKNPVTEEFYITDLIDIIASQNKKIASYKLDTGSWRGVNTKEDLIEAERLANNDNSRI